MAYERKMSNSDGKCGNLHFILTFRVQKVHLNNELLLNKHFITMSSKQLAECVYKFSDLRHHKYTT